MRAQHEAVIIAVVIALAALGAVLFLRDSGSFDLPNGESRGIGERAVSGREIMETDGVKHSIPLGEILSGGPPKDGIPSIDEPKFVSTAEADAFLKDEEPGLGLSYKGEERFYPFQIMVWHEIANDTVAGDPVLITYCPLCLTGIAFERRVDGRETEFGVSGRLWQSNLLMYDRTGDSGTESLWSQVLGEAVVGPQTGAKIAIIPSDVVRYGDWKAAHPNTSVLSRDTGASRAYGRDPYGDYYTDNAAVGFGATFSDTRLDAKEIVFGVGADGKFKAYKASALPVGETRDTLGGTILSITKSTAGEVRVTNAGTGESVPVIYGFWFSWAAVHPETEVWTGP